jgi:hypothetical protein
MKIILLITLLDSLALALWMMIRWRAKSRRSKVPATLLQRPVMPASVDLALNAGSSSLDATRWAFINEWHLEGQANDRKPMRVGVVDGAGSASERRSATRRSHQMMYKEWSQARHD